ncbi:MAG: 50S ribosomal protein L28 [Candidatus Paceibacterota bacterium]
MAKECVITGKSTRMGGGYSNRTRATQFNPTGKRRRKANIKRHRIYVPELNRHVSINVSARGLKTIAKKGPYKALKDAGVI